MEATTNLTVLALLLFNSASTSLSTSLCLHKILVSYTLSILLPQTALFPFSSRAVIRQLRLVKQLPQPGRVLLVRKSEDGWLVLEVVQSDEDGVWST